MRSASYRISPLWLLLLTVLVAQLLFGVYLVQMRFDRDFGDYRATEEILYIEDGRALKKALLGFENLAADLYWLRTVQYFGGKRLAVENKRFDLLEPLLEITTDLDPHLKIAYSYGAIFLSEEPPRGQGEPQKGVRLLDKGIENNPEHWRFYLDKGFLYYWYYEDYRKAAEVFLEGSNIPGAPYWLVATAGRTLTMGGDRVFARELWTHLFETAENDQMKANAMIHLQQLDALDMIDTLNGWMKAYEEEKGRFPESWQALIDEDVLSGVPKDPTGVPFVLNPREKRVEMAMSSPLSGLPVR